MPNPAERSRYMPAPLVNWTPMEEPARWTAVAGRRGPSMAIVAITLLICAQNCRTLPVDLEVYRRGAQVIVDGHDTVYDTPYGLLPFTYPPIAALSFVPLALMPGVLAAVVMATTSVIALFVVVRLFWRTLGYTTPKVLTSALLLLSCRVEPVSETLGFGQVNLLLAAIVFWDLTHPRSRWSGVLLGIAISIKLTPLVFLALPLLRRDWLFLRRSLAAVVFGVLAPSLTIPRSSRQFWFDAVTDPGRVGGVAYSGNQSINGLIWRLVGEGGDPVIAAAMCVSIVAVALFGVWQHRASDPLSSILMLALCGLLISPISWSHHWVWVVPIMIWLGHTARSRSRRGDGGRGTGTLAVLGGLWAFATLSRVIWWGPAGGDSEYSAPVLLKLASGAYPILGVATLLVMVFAVSKPRTSTHAMTRDDRSARPAVATRGGRTTYGGSMYFTGTACNKVR